MLRKLPASDFTAGPFDVKSIMMYQFPAWFFKAGEKAKCYPPALNLDVSEGDLRQIAALYPKDEAARAALSETIRRDFETLWTKADSKSRLAVGYDAVRAYFGKGAE